MAYYVKLDQQNAIDWATLSSEPSEDALQVPCGEERVWLEPNANLDAIVVDETYKKQVLNQRALDAYTKLKQFEANADMEDLFAGDAGTIVAMANTAQNLITLVTNIQSVAGIADNQLSQAAQDAKTALSQATGGFTQIANLWTTMQAEIAAFVPPHVVDPLYPPA